VLELKAKDRNANSAVDVQHDSQQQTTFLCQTN